MEGLKKHYGFLSNTGTRIVVVFRALPAEPTNALVVSLDALPDAWRDEVLNAVNSQAGQQTVDLYTTLQHRNFSDGTNVLSGLHTRGYLKKVAVDQVTMTPITGQNVPLKMVNAACDKTLDKYVSDETDKVATVVDEVQIDPEVLAKGLVAEAHVMQEKAAAMLEEAYTLVPALKPGRGRPALESEEREKSDAAKKEKRLERDRANAIKLKEDKKEQAIIDKLNKKVLRDANRASPVETADSDTAID